MNTIMGCFNEGLSSFTVNGVSFNMIRVEGGTFTMGATSEQIDEAKNDERPAHLVELRNYYIGDTPVTQGLWRAIMGTYHRTSLGDKFPVQYTSFEECKEFLCALNNLTGKKFRLPTEAEWEFAARGGNKSKGYKYAGSNYLGDVAWYRENSNYEIHEVKGKKPNELGLYDMSGNVWEWCSDWYGVYPHGTQSNPLGPSKGDYHIFRGGSYCTVDNLCRTSFRYFYHIGMLYNGFRLVL